MTICFIIKDLRTNGANRVIVNYANELQKNGHSVVCFIEYEAFYPTEFALNCQIKSIASLVTHNHYYDIVISTFYSNHIFLSTIGASVKIQFIQDNYFRYGEKSIKRKKQIENCLFDKTTKKIVVSNYLCDFYNNIGVESDVISNGVDFSLFYYDSQYKSKNSSKTVLIEGLIDRPYLNVKKAYTLIPNSFEIWGLSTKPHCIPTCKKMFVNPPQTDLKKIYNGANYLLELEENEGFNLVLLEAMACGCVVLTTPCGGHMDFCRRMINSIIIEQDSDVAYFLKLLSQDSKLYNQISENAKLTSQDYSLESSYKKLNRLVEKYNFK